MEIERKHTPFNATDRIIGELDELYKDLPIRIEDGINETRILDEIKDRNCYFLLSYKTDGFGDFSNCFTLIKEIFKYFNKIIVILPINHFGRGNTFFDLDYIIENHLLLKDKYGLETDFLGYIQNEKKKANLYELYEQFKKSFQLDRMYSLDEFLNNDYIKKLIKYSNRSKCDGIPSGVSQDSKLYTTKYLKMFSDKLKDNEASCLFYFKFLKKYLDKLVCQKNKEIECNILLNSSIDNAVQYLNDIGFGDCNYELYCFFKDFYNLDPEKFNVLYFDEMNNSMDYRSINRYGFGISPNSYLGLKSLEIKPIPNDRKKSLFDLLNILEGDKYTVIYTNAILLCDIIGGYLYNYPHYHIMFIILIIYHSMIIFDYNKLIVFCSDTFLEILSKFNRFFNVEGLSDFQHDNKNVKSNIPHRLQIRVSIINSTYVVFQINNESKHDSNPIELHFKFLPILDHELFITLLRLSDNNIPIFLTGDHSYMEGFILKKKVLASLRYEQIGKISGIETILQIIDKILYSDKDPLLKISSILLEPKEHLSVDSDFSISPDVLQDHLIRYFQALTYLCNYLIDREPNKLKFEDNFRAILINKMTKILEVEITC